MRSTLFVRLNAVATFPVDEADAVRLWVFRCAAAFAALDGIAEPIVSCDTVAELQILSFLSGSNFY